MTTTPGPPCLDDIAPILAFAGDDWQAFLSLWQDGINDHRCLLFSRGTFDNREHTVIIPQAVTTYSLRWDREMSWIAFSYWDCTSCRTRTYETVIKRWDGIVSPRRDDRLVLEPLFDETITPILGRTPWV